MRPAVGAAASFAPALEQRSLRRRYPRGSFLSSTYSVAAGGVGVLEEYPTASEGSLYLFINWARIKGSDG